MFEARGHSEIFRELRFAASVERVRNYALIDVRRDTTDIAFAEKNTFGAALRPRGAWSG